MSVGERDRMGRRREGEEGKGKKEKKEGKKEKKEGKKGRGVLGGGVCVSARTCEQKGAALMRSKAAPAQSRFF